MLVEIRSSRKSSVQLFRIVAIAACCTLLLLALSAMCLVGCSGASRVSDPLCGYDLNAVTNILLSPVSRSDMILSQPVTISNAEEIAELTRTIQNNSPWQILVPGTSGHWFSDRRLKLIMESPGREPLALWVEFCVNSPNTVARFDRLPNLSTDDKPWPMADTASVGFGSALLRIIHSRGVTWNKNQR